MVQEMGRICYLECNIYQDQIMLGRKRSTCKTMNCGKRENFYSICVNDSFTWCCTSPKCIVIMWSSKNDAIKIYGILILLRMYTTSLGRINFQ